MAKTIEKGRPTALPKPAKKPRVARALEEGEGILRVAPCWVPRSFLTPGRRLKLHPDDYYAIGAHRGGIDERWLSSTTEAANDNRAPDEGLSYVVHDGSRFTLREAVAQEGARLIGKAMSDKYKRWPVYSKFFDNLGPIPSHMHQDDEQARLVGQQGKPESYYFPPQLNNTVNTFPHTYYGLEPGTSKDDIRRCLADWHKGDNGLLDHSKAYRLRVGTGWLIPPRVLHAPGSILTYEPQWGSDVFAMFQSMVECRCVPWALLVKDVPKSKQHDLDYLVELLDWEFNTATNFKERCYLEPLSVEKSESEGWVDQWIVYGKVRGKQLFSARELTIQPGARVTIRDAGASGVIAVQGKGCIGIHDVETPVMVRFGTMTQDEVFISHEAAVRGVRLENTGTEPFVTLRYFGPDAWKTGYPEVGDARKGKRG
jgi:hypothetical protein